jgi:hypothetical protein
MGLRSKKNIREMTKKVTGMHKGKDTNLRRSNRTQTKSDEHTLEKTTRMAEIRNLKAPGTKSFVSFPNSRISSNLDKPGISLGRDDNVIRSSTVAIKNIEIDRLVVTAKNKKQQKDNSKNNKKSPTITDYNDEERDERLEATLNHICGDINEEAQEQHYENICCDLKAVPRKSKLSSANKIKNGRPPKKPNTPSKIRIR